MSDPRDLGTVPPALLEASGELLFADYVRMDFPDVTRRFTNFREGGDVRDIGDGAGAQTFLHDRLLELAGHSEGMVTPSNVSTVTLGDGDGIFFDYAMSPAGLWNVPFTWRHVWFDPDTLAPAGALELFTGYLDAPTCEVRTKATIALRPFKASFVQIAGYAITEDVWPTLPPDGLVVNWGTVTKPLPSRTALRSVTP